MKASHHYGVNGFMQKKNYVIAILGFTGLFFSLHADQTAIQTSQQHEQSANAPEKNVSEGDLAAWMIETSQIAKEYVDGLDKGQYAQSWTKGDQLFQHTITQPEWEEALNDNRKKLGKVNSRTLKRQLPAWDPKGLPKGPYMVVEYNTDFENAHGSGELLTLRRGTDGKWRVLTYQVN